MKAVSESALNAISLGRARRPRALATLFYAVPLSGGSRA